MLFVIGIIVIVILTIDKIRSHFFLAPCKSKVCLVGKTALVTGGSSGIGYEIVLDLASRGCRVIIADVNVNESVKDAIVRETNNPNIVLKYVDLASFKSVRDLAADLKSSEPVLDILINNAGIGRHPSSLTEDNLHPVLQVNYYSGFLITHLLLDLLKNSKSGRIIFTSSFLSFFHTVSMDRILEDKIDENNCFAYYGDSKFLQIVASKMFAKKLKQFGITSNTFHPFASRTPIFKTMILGPFDKVYYYIVKILLSVTLNANEGAQTGIYLACAKEVQDVTGEFFGAASISIKPRSLNDTSLCEAIWKCSEVAVKLKPAEKIQ